MEDTEGKMNLNAVYVEGVMAFHNLRDKTKESISKLQEADVKQTLQSVQNRAHRTLEVVKGKFAPKTPSTSQSELIREYPHIFRRKSIWELILLSGAVCGIEFCYAAETAFVSPTLLSLGIDVKFMTMIWCLSPIVGFLVTPLLGSMSDSCHSRFGRRRPFIVLLSVGILLGLLLVPNGEDIGIALGDVAYELEYNVTGTNFSSSSTQRTFETSDSNYTKVPQEQQPTSKQSQPWGVIFTVLGTVLLDFCADACQSPSRTYLLDVTVPEDHGIGLSTFTMMAGFGGAIGYLMGAINWEATGLGALLGGHVRAVFTIVTVMFIICMIGTITSFAEIPLSVLENQKPSDKKKPSERVEDKVYVAQYKKLDEDTTEDTIIHVPDEPIYGTTSEPSPVKDTEESFVCNKEDEIGVTVTGGQPTFKEYLVSIFRMPKSLAILCLTHLFCWMALVCYSLYFTDFVGEYIYGGDPQAPPGSPMYELYEDGVRFGCWGMAAYSIACCVYSCCIEILIRKIGTKTVYIGSQIIFALGMAGMALWRQKAAVIVLSTTSGIMYGTIFTVPYVLVSHYHCMKTFDGDLSGSKKEVRGIGTDVAIISSMIFIAQFLLSLTMGSIVSAIGSSATVVWSAAVLSLCGAVCATQVLYLDL